MEDAAGMLPPQQYSPQQESRLPSQFLRPPSSNAATGRGSAMGYNHPPGTSEAARMSAGSVASMRPPQQGYQQYQQRPPSAAQSHLSSNPSLAPPQSALNYGDLDRYPSFGGQNSTRDTSPFIPQLANGRNNGSASFNPNFNANGHIVSPLGISDLGPGPNRASGGQLPPPGSFDPHSRPGSRMTNGPPPSAMSRYSGSSQLSLQGGPYQGMASPNQIPQTMTSQQGPYPNVARSTAVELELPPYVLRQQQKQGKQKTLTSKSKNLFKWKKGKRGSAGDSDEDYEEDGVDIDDYSFAPPLMDPEFEQKSPVMSRQFSPGQAPSMYHQTMQQQQQQQQRPPFQQPVPYSMPPPNGQFPPHHFQQQQQLPRPSSQQPQQPQPYLRQQPHPHLQHPQQQQQQLSQRSHSPLENPVPVNTPPLSDSATTSLGNHSTAPSSRGSHHSQHAFQSTMDHSRVAGTDANSRGNSQSSNNAPSFSEADFKQLYDELAESINREAQLESLLQQSRGGNHESSINPNEFIAQNDREQELLRVIRTEAQEKAKLRLEFFEKLQQVQMQESREPKEEKDEEKSAREEAIKKEAAASAAVERQKELSELTQRLNDLNTELDECKKERDGLKLETVPKLEKQITSYDNDARVLQQLLEDKVRLQEELASERLNKDIHSKDLIESEKSPVSKTVIVPNASTEDRIKGLEQQRTSLSEALRKTVEMRRIEGREHEVTIQRLRRKLHLAQARSLNGLIPRSVQHDAYVQKLEAEIKQYARIVSDLENKREQAMNYSMYLFDKTSSTANAHTDGSTKNKLPSPNKALLLSKPGKARNNSRRPSPVQTNKNDDNGLPSAAESLSHSSSTSQSPETLYSPLDDVNLEPSHIKDIYQALDATFDRALSRIDTLETEREIMLSTADSSSGIKTN